MNVLYSKTGSSGNCSIVQNSNGKMFCIDAGLPFDKVNKETKYKLQDVEFCLVTHAHSDHTSHLSDFVKRGITCIALPESLSELKLKPNKRYLKQSPMPWTHLTSDWIVKSAEMVHTNSDGSNCPCCGFLIVDKTSGEKMLWATDTMYIPNRFPALDYYCIECNYFEEDDWSTSIEYAQKFVEQRRVSSHMSFETCVKFLQMQDLSKCKEIRLLHLSGTMTSEQRNSIPILLREKVNIQDGVKIYV